MKYLFTAFNGKTNSSKILLDSINIPKQNKLYLKISFTTSTIYFEQKISDNKYDLSFRLDKQN